jgi:hypothetical protein
LTTSQAAVLSTQYLSVPQEAAFLSITPLVLDLSGTGIQTLGIAQSGVKFDLNNSGVDANVGWITPGEGFLVHLPKGATTITNGSELFGSATVMPNGQTATNGFAALSAFDSNGTGIIDSSDPIFNELQVWVDTGSNGTTPTGNLYTLAQLNIQSLNLNASITNQSNNGNTIGMVSSYTTTSGQTYEMADVWLTSAAGTSSTASQLAQLLAQYTSNSTNTLANGSVYMGAVTNAGSTANGNSDTHSQSVIAPVPVAAMSNALGSALAQYSNSSVITSVSVVPQSGSTILATGTTVPANPTPIVGTNTQIP